MVSSRIGNYLVADSVVEHAVAVKHHPDRRIGDLGRPRLAWNRMPWRERYTEIRKS